MFVTPGRLNKNGQPYAWNMQYKVWEVYVQCCVCTMLFNVCVHVVLVLIVCVCVCLCVCVSVYLCVCVFVCVSVTAVAGATGPFKSSVRSFPPNLPLLALSIILALLDRSTKYLEKQKQP